MNQEKTTTKRPDFSYPGRYSYADYLTWNAAERVDLIDGKASAIEKPNRMHQMMTGRIAGMLWLHLRGQRGEVFVSPFDVRLPEHASADEDVFTVVQPDVCVFLDREKLDDRGAIGPPDIAVEVLGENDNTKDIHEKYAVYEKSGVKDYWLIAGESKFVLAYRLQENGLYTTRRLQTEGDVVQSIALPGFELDLDELFADLE